MRKTSLILLILVASVASAQPSHNADDISRRALDILGGGPAWDKAMRALRPPRIRTRSHRSSRPGRQRAEPAARRRRR